MKYRPITQYKLGKDYSKICDCKRAFVSKGFEECFACDLESRVDSVKKPWVTQRVEIEV